MGANLKLIPPTLPLIVASEHSADDYTCGKCGTLLLQANHRGALKLLILCANLRGVQFNDDKDSGIALGVCGPVAALGT
jgi:hypothetical protein